MNSGTSVRVPAGVTSSSNSLTHVVMIVALAMTSVSAILTKTGLEHVRPLPFSAARFLGGAVCVMLVAARRGDSLRAVPRMAVLLPAALIGVVANTVLFTVALRLTTAVEVSLLAGLAPIMTAIALMVIWRARPPWQQIVALPVGFAGVFAVVSPNLAHGQSFAGDLVALAWPLSWAVFLLLATPLARTTPASVLTFWIMAIGLVVLIPIGAAQTLDGHDHWLAALPQLAFSAVLGTGLSYFAYMWCLPRVGTTGTAIYGYLQPPLGAGAAAVFLHEPFGVSQGVGAVIILVSAVLGSSGAK